MVGDLCGIIIITDITFSHRCPQNSDPSTNFQYQSIHNVAKFTLLLLLERPDVKRLPLLLIFILPLGVHAEKGQSIMFGDPDPIYQEKTLDTTADEQNEHCKQLRRQMEELKGKPQRRWAVSERIKLECQAPSD